MNIKENWLSNPNRNFDKYIANAYLYTICTGYKSFSNYLFMLFNLLITLVIGSYNTSINTKLLTQWTISHGIPAIHHAIPNLIPVGNPLEKAVIKIYGMVQIAPNNNPKHPENILQNHIDLHFLNI